MKWVHNRVLGGARAVIRTSVWIAWRALAVALVLIPAAGAVSLSVGEGGTPVYSLPIGVPPGIAGMAPAVGLLYTGSDANGPVGHGWSLQGISTITRCPNIRAVDGSTRRIDYTSSDKLCLDGQRLIQTGATGVALAFPQSDDSLGVSTGFREYRTEKDSFARIRAYGSSGGTAANGPAYFKVWTKSGQIYEYGNNANASANAAINAQGKTAIAVWAVSRISDTLGNYIDFQYEQRDVAWGSGPSTGPSLGHEWNLLEIRYTGTPTQQPVNRVIFEYADRPDTPALGQDRSEAYHQGSKNLSVRRLNAVRTFINWPGNVASSPVPSTAIKVKTVKLTYDQSPLTRRSRLTTLQECAGSTESQCLPATGFSYSNGGDEAYAPNPNFNQKTLVLLSTAGDYGMVPVDFNGDGKTDLLRWSSTPAQNQLLLSDGNGAFTSSSAFTLTSTADTLFTSNGCYSSLVTDIDGDGLPDIFRYSSATDVNGVACPSPGPHTLYKNIGGGAFAASAYTGPPLSRLVAKATPCLPMPCSGFNSTIGRTFYFLDINGDGRLDILTTVLPATVEGGNDCPGQPATCTRVFVGDGQGTFTEIPTNLINTPVYTQPSVGVPRSSGRDLDGDGLADLAGMKTTFFGTSSMFRSRGDGNFDAAVPTTGTCAEQIDVNGDGRNDCLSPSPTAASLNALSIWTGSSSPFVPVSNFNLTAAGNELGGTGVGYTSIDLNGDGRTDILRWKDDPTKNVVYLSNGDGTFRPSSSFNLNTVDRKLQKSDGTVGFVVGDFLGRGTPDILRILTAPTGSAEGTTNQLYLKVDATPPDRLLSVVESTGLTTTLAWAPLTDSVSGSLGARYASDRGNATYGALYPKIDLSLPMQVVVTSIADTGVGATQLATEYSYRGLKGSYDGRGGPAFRETRRQTVGANGSPVTAVTQYLHDHPYTGAASKAETYLGNLNALPATPLSRSSFTYCEKSASASQGTATPTAPCAVAATTKVQRPYLYKQVDEGSELPANGGATLPTVTTTTAYNNSGNPTDIVVTTQGTALGISQTVTKTTTNVYNPDDTAGDNWILGRLQSATQRVIVPDSLGSITTVAGSAPLASATQGSAPGITLSTPSFPNTLVGSTITATATLSNAGSISGWVTPPTSSSVTGANFSFVSTTCTSSLAGGATCTVTVRFSPTAGGTRTGSLAVATEAGTKTVTLTAVGVVPIALAFSGCSSNSPTTAPTAASMTCTLNNSGGAVTSISYSAITGATVTGPTGACAASATCGTVTVTTGTTAGTYSGTLTATPNTGSGASTAVSLQVNTPATMALTGCTSNSPTTSPAAASLSCTLRNTGQTAASSISYSAISGASVSGPTGACAAGATCGTVTVTTGTAAGTYSGTLTATPNSGSAASTAVSLVVYTLPALALNGCSSNSPTISPAAATLSCTLSNTGQTAAGSISYSAIPGATVSGPTGACAGGATCGTVTVTTGTAAGTYSGTLTATPSSGSAASTAVGLVVNASLFAYVGASVTSNTDFNMAVSFTFRNDNAISVAIVARGMLWHDPPGVGASISASSTCVEGNLLAPGTSCTVNVSAVKDCEAQNTIGTSLTNSAGTRNSSLVTVPFRRVACPPA